MNTFKIIVKDRLAVIALDRGRSNPINHEMIKEITAQVKSLEADPAIAGLMITGKEGFFSSGIDLVEAYDYDEEQSKAFWIDFLAMQTALASFKKPLVAAISGHSPAGGCVMAICCDYRVMEDGPFIIGLNEIPVGIIVPDSVFSLYSLWLGQHKAYQYLMEGKLLKVNEALDAGLIDEVCAAGSLMSTAEKKIRTYMQFNPVTWSQSKLNLRADLLRKLNQNQDETLAKMIEQWWAPATRKGLEMMIQNLKSKSTAASN